MAQTVEMCDIPIREAAMLLEAFNHGKVLVVMASDIDKVVRIITSAEPKDLVYPSGWYYANGNFTNKHNSTTNSYSAIKMHNANTGEVWNVPYCTAD